MSNVNASTTFVSIHRAISWAMSLLKVQSNICTKATLGSDESGCCGEVGRGGNITIFLRSTCLLCSAYAYHMPRIVLLTLTRSQMTFNRQKQVGTKCQSAKVPKVQICIGLQEKNWVLRVQVLSSGFYCTEKWYRSVVYELVYKRFLCVYWKAQMDWAELILIL